MNKKRILIFGSGVIGSTYGGLMALSGQDVTLLARNKRLSDLNRDGLLLHRNGQGKTQRIKVDIISELKEDDIYDFVFVTLRKDQVRDALPNLSRNKSPDFVFMVNNPSGYEEWINALGKERVIPAFPGSGGKIENGIVYYDIVSGIIQPTTMGELNGQISSRVKALKKILKKAGFNVTVSKNMDSWQKNHVGLVGPLGDVIYFDGGNNYSVAQNPVAIRQMNLALRENFDFLHYSGIGIEPQKFHLIRILPLWILNFSMKYVYSTKWAESVISNHALNARDEMKVLSHELLEVARSKGYDLKEFKKLVERI